MKSRSMKLRTLLASVTLCLASLVSVPAFAGGFAAPIAQPTTAPAAAPFATPVATPATMARPIMASPSIAAVNTRDFIVRVRTQMNQIETAARLGIARRQLRPQVLGALRQDRAAIESSLRPLMHSPVTTAFDAQRIEARVNQMSQLSASYQTRFARR
jgi:hypothetical protein